MHEPPEILLPRGCVRLLAFLAIAIFIAAAVLAIVLESMHIENPIGTG
jgi:hypothetical protein